MLFYVILSMPKAGRHNFYNFYAKWRLPAAGRPKSSCFSIYTMEYIRGY
jgi:hypothetical protein